MNAPERAPFPAGKPDARSPFMRLADLLAGIEPGLPPINISVGEPQHPVPAFVAPVLAKHTAAFGRYPGNAGTDGFRSAVAAWLGRRYQLPRPIDLVTVARECPWGVTTDMWIAEPFYLRGSSAEEKAALSAGAPGTAAAGR